MVDCFLGEIRIFAGNFAPQGWALCNGQLMAISQNTALFSLLGTMYGGNGQTNFALPNLQGRVPIAFGQGPGLSDYFQGEETGSETVTLISTEMPMHTHLANANSGGGNSTDPTNNIWAASSRRDNSYAATSDSAMNPLTLGITGGNQPHNNLQPYLVLNYIIALQGIFPPRG